MKHRGNQPNNRRLSRFLSGLLCAAVLCGLVPSGVTLTGSAQAAEQAVLAWSDQDLDTLRSYDIMHGDDGGMRPNDSISRAEFAAMVNRALGYKERASSTPFKDVASSDWFSDDISISYNMGYLNGITSTAAGPYSTLTREQALVILSRNLMFQPTVGESFSYADTRTFGEWSRGYIDPAVEAGILDADPASNFDPGEPITRGELAGMLLRAIGTPIQTAGVRSLGTVDGNVTITTPGVTLRNTTINGDLYLTGGIGLGDVLLDSVTVNGKIIDSGAGLSEKGEISVILNNVTADELIVDSMRNQTISLSAKGNTEIPKTSLRTSARVEDSTATGYGLRVVEIDGEEKTSAVLSGNVKEVVNKTPNSTLNIGEGVAEKVTVDEAATGSSVTVGKDARIKYLNLDAGASVTGSGMVDSLTISAAGSTLNLPQMPDEIIIAPGVTANVNKQQMDSAAAAEASSRPRLLPGYPGVENLAPTSATALFQTNKPGTVYWAITARADGSPAEEDIISPPSYSKAIVKSGSVKVRESNKEYTARISGLTSDGAYYLSVIMVDDKGVRSTMKVTAFTTPDNTTPAFSKGYPEEAQISEKDAQFAFMTTKDCYLYYTVLPKGSTAPRAIDFKTGSISGNMGYGVVKMAKNTPSYIFVNSVSLEEKQPYVLYLWLTDFDGAKSSAVKAVNFTTEDRTPPIVSNVRQTGSTTNSVSNGYVLNEAGTLYWAVVATGDKSFMGTPAPGFTVDNWLQSTTAKERLAAGTGAIKSGKTSVSAAKAGTDMSFNVSGLNTKKTGTSAYDLYYVARDSAGNWSDVVRSIAIYTKDDTAPTVVQKFTNFDNGDTEDTLRPLANTNIKLVFSKQVGASDVNGDGSFLGFLDLYRGTASDKAKLADLLRNTIQFYQVPTGGGKGVLAEDKKDHPNDDNWVIDYTKATVYQEGTTMVVEFPNSTTGGTTALQLSNGRTYYFVVSPTKGDIRDTTSNNKEMDPKTLDRFTTLPAQIHTGEAKGVGGTIEVDGKELNADFKFQFEPQSTFTAPEDVYYDVMIWCNTTLKFDLYTRSKENTSNTWSSWEKVNTASKSTFDYVTSDEKSVYQTIGGVNGDTKYTGKELRSLREDYTYQFAVNITSIGDNNTDRKTWNLEPQFRVTVASGSPGQLTRLANRKSEENWNTILADTTSNVESIGSPKPYYSENISISDQVPPVLSGNYPTFTNVLDHSATMNFALNNKGTIYYVVSPAIADKDDDGNVISVENRVEAELESGKTMNPYAKADTAGSATSEDRAYYADGVPLNGSQVEKHNTNPGEDGTVNTDEAILKSPGRDGIINKKITDDTVRQDNVEFNGVSTAQVDLDDLLADTWYYVYLLFEGSRTSEKAVCYKFKTSPPIRPILSLQTTESDKHSGSVTATVNGSSGNVTARITPTSDLPRTVFSWPFKLAKDETISGQENTLGFDFLNDKGKDRTFRDDYTILNAMCDSVGTTGTASIFDTYASTDLQNYVANLIKNGFGYDVGKWPATGASQLIRKDASAPMTFTLPTPDVKYFCVALAENTTPGADHGFSAHSEVQIVDDVEPTADTLSGGLSREEKMELSEDGNTRTYTYTLTGTLTVQYANTLYRYDSVSGQALLFTQAGQPDKDGKQNPLGAFNYNNETEESTEVTKRPTSTDDPVAQWYGVKNLYVRDGVKVVTSGGVPQKGNEFTIEVSIPLGTRTSTKTTTPMLDKDGNPIKDKWGEVIYQETWSEVTAPASPGTINLPSDFVNRSGIPASVRKNISYKFDKDGNVTTTLTVVK